MRRLTAEKTFTVFGTLKKHNQYERIRITRYISTGETSKVQFKEELPISDSIAQMLQCLIR